MTKQGFTVSIVCHSEHSEESHKQKVQHDRILTLSPKGDNRADCTTIPNLEFRICKYPLLINKIYVILIKHTRGEYARRVIVNINNK